MLAGGEIGAGDEFVGLMRHGDRAGTADDRRNAGLLIEAALGAEHQEMADAMADMELRAAAWGTPAQDDDQGGYLVQDEAAYDDEEF